MPYLYKLLGWEPKDKILNFAEFERTVLQSAKKEIEEKTGLRFEYQAVKEGRSVIKVIFNVKEKTKIYSEELLEGNLSAIPLYIPNEEKIQEQIQKSQLYLDLARFLPKEKCLDDSLNPYGLLNRRITVKNWKSGLSEKQIDETNRIYEYVKRKREQVVA